MALGPIYDVVGYTQVRQFHLVYFLVIGWWAGLMVACFMLPLFFPGGRRLITRLFGYW